MNHVFSDPTPLAEPIVMGNKKYVLREASEGAVCKWRNVQIRSAKFDEKGKLSSPGDVADSEPTLVSECVFETINPDNSVVIVTFPDGSQHSPGQKVSFNKVCNWPSRIVRPLFERIKQISGLNEVETEETLNEKIGKLQEELEEIVKAKQRKECGEQEDYEKKSTSDTANTTA